MSFDNVILCNSCFCLLKIKEEKTIGVVSGRCYRCGQKVAHDDSPAGHLVCRGVVVHPEVTK